MSVMIMTEESRIYLNEKDTGYCYCDAIDLIASCGFWYINCFFTVAPRFFMFFITVAVSFIADLLDVVTDFMKAGSSVMYILVGVYLYVK